jgi:serpin B
MKQKTIALFSVIMLIMGTPTIAEKTEAVVGGHNNTIYHNQHWGENIISRRPPLNINQELITANNKFGFKLFFAIWEKGKKENIFISPNSIAIALEMLYNGASGATKEEMTQALFLQELSLEEINQANQELRQALQNADPNVQLAIANSLWARKGITFNDQFLANNQNFYEAKITDLDFNEPDAKNIINQWVTEATRNKITEIIDEITPEDVLFIINALYFKGNWTYQFQESNTTEKPFYVSQGIIQQHLMMSRSGEYRYYENEQFQAISLPYGQEKLSMYIFLPRENSDLDTFISNISPEKWQDWLSQFQKKSGLIEIPKFDLEYEIELRNILGGLGMISMFNPEKADFSLMTPEQVKVDQVKHKTFLEVNEKGTEAAAVTSIGIRTTSFDPTPPFEMIVNRPFFCAIQDNQTGTILFMGAIRELRD